MQTGSTQLVQPCSLVFSPDDSIQRALQMLSQAQIGQALVVEAQIPVGILTEPVLEAAVATGRSLHSPISDLMQPPIVALDSEIPSLLTIIQVLQQQSCLPVVNQLGQLTGVILPEKMPLSIQSIALASEANLRRALQQQTEALRQEMHQRQQLAQDLEASKIRYRSILNNLPDLVSCFLADGTITFANRAYCQFFQQPLEAILGQSCFATLPDAQRQVVQQNIALLSQTKGSLTFEQQLADGRWIEWTDCAVCDEAGAVIEFQSIGRDITERQAALIERQQAEATLRASEARHRAMLEAVPDLLVRVQPDGICLDCLLPQPVSSPAPEPAQHLADLLPSSALPLALKAIQRALQTGELQLFEHASVKQDQVVYEEVRAVACGEQEVLLMVRDMTSQRQSEFQFRRLTENVPGVVYRYVLWPNGFDQMTYISPRCCEVLDIAPEAILQDMTMLWDMIPPPDRDRIRQSTASSARTLQPWCLEFRVLTPAGTLKWIRGFSKPEPQPNGSMAWDGLLMDITDSKRASDALQSSEAKLRSILENTPSLISLIDQQGTTLFINRALAGRAAASLIGCRFTDYLTPAQPDQLEASLKTVFERAKPARFEAVGLGKDHPTAYYEVCIAPVQSAWDSDLGRYVSAESLSGSRRVETATVIAVDISARKQTELALRRQEAKLLLAMETGKIVCWENDLIAQTVSIIGEHQSGNQWQPGYTQMPADESYQLIHPDDRERVRRLVADSIGKTDEFEEIHRRIYPDGSTAWMLSKGKLLTDGDGNVTRIVGISINISERRRIELALEASEARFRAIFEHAAVGISQVSLTGQLLRVNQRYCELLGYSEAELLERSLVDVTHPADWEMARRAIQQMVQGEVNAISIEKRCICKNGQWRWVHLTGSWVQDDLQGCPYLIGVTEDIHDRKQAEARLDAQRMFLHDVIDAVPNGIFVKDREGRMLTINRAGAAIYGVTVDDWIGKTDLELGADPGQVADYMAVNREVMATRQPKLIPAQLTRDLQGNLRWYRVVISPFIDAEGEVQGIIGTATEITDLKQVETELQAQKDFLQRIIDMVPSALFVRNTEGQVIVTNQAGADIYGITVQDWLENSDYDLGIDPALVDQLLESNREVMATRQPQLFPAQAVQSLRGEQRWYQTRIEPFIDAADQVQGIIGVSVDMTDRRQIEADLRQAKEAAEAANLAKSQFLANMSHELRTPLNSILGFAQLLHQEQLRPEQQDQVGIILRSGEHLLKLINDVLEMSKIDAGRMSLNLVDFDLHQLLDNLQEMLQVRAMAKNLALVFDAPDCPRYIQTDESKLRQVLLNLLGNALKFTQAGQVRLRLQAAPLDAKTQRQILLQREANSESEVFNPLLANPDLLLLQVTVQDTGPGIAAPELASLFTPFLQTEIGRQTQEGTGLGLAISRRFVELMGGSIQVTSTAGQGAKFEFQIPVRPVSPGPAQTSLPLASANLVPVDYRILVAEDQALNRQMVVQLLTGLGFKVQQAANGEEAIALWQQWSPHLILMDMRMPVLDGYEAVREIRRREQAQPPICEQKGSTVPITAPSGPLTGLAASAHVPVAIIALTASAFEEERNQIFAAGCNGYVPKPFKVGALLAEIASQLNLQVAAHQAEQNGLPAGDPTAPPTHSMADLANLPLDWRQALHQAATQLNSDSCAQLIQQLACEAELKHWLLHLVEEFRFDLLIDLADSGPLDSGSLDSGLLDSGSLDSGPLNSAAPE